MGVNTVHMHTKTHIRAHVRAQRGEGGYLRGEGLRSLAAGELLLASEAALKVDGRRHGTGVQAHHQAAAGGAVADGHQRAHVLLVVGARQQRRLVLAHSEDALNAEQPRSAGGDTRAGHVADIRQRAGIGGT